MRQVVLCWSSGVTDEEGAEVEAGIRQVLQVVDQDQPIDILGNGWDADRWIKHTSNDGIGYGPQIREEKLYYHILDSLATRESMGFADLDDRFVVVAAVNVDLEPSDGNWLYGATRIEPVSISMLSVARLRRMEPSLRRGALRRLARHEFGHALGLIPDNRSENVTVEEGSFGHHCTNLCSMRQTDVGGGAPTLEAATVEEKGQGIRFCAQCIADLRFLNGE